MGEVTLSDEKVLCFCNSANGFKPQPDSPLYAEANDMVEELRQSGLVEEDDNERYHLTKQGKINLLTQQIRRRALSGGDTSALQEKLQDLTDVLGPHEGGRHEFA